MQFSKGAQKGKGTVKNHMNIQNHSGDTTGVSLKTQTQAVHRSHRFDQGNLF